jgi:hypothetical protein
MGAGQITLFPASREHLPVRLGIELLAIGSRVLS